MFLFSLAPSIINSLPWALAGEGRIDKFKFSLFYTKYKSFHGDRALPSEEFLNWFIGFTEGDGSFIVNKRGDLAFVITQSTSDIQVLTFIKDILGFGKVINQSALTSRYVCQAKSDIELIIYSIVIHDKFAIHDNKKRYTLIKIGDDWKNRRNCLYHIMNKDETIPLQ